MPHPSTRHYAVAWLAARATSSSDTSDLAVLRLWARVSADDENEALAQELLALEDRLWRRFGRLLFVADGHSVRTMVSIMRSMATDTMVSKTSPAWISVRRRMWKDGWRQLLHEKLSNCLALLEQQQQHGKSGERSRLFEEHETLCLQLMDTMTVLFSSLRRELLPKDVVWWIDVLVEQSKCVASDRLASQATAALGRLVQDAASLQEDVRAYLLAVDVVFNHHLTMLLSSTDRLQRPRSRDVAVQQRRVLSLDLLLHGARQSADVLAMLDREHRVLQVVMQTAHNPEDRDHDRCSAVSFDQLERALLLLELTLAGASNSTCTLTAIRLSGALISLAWLLLHRALTMRSIVFRVWRHVLAQSPRQDLLRALVEQGCVLVLFLVCLESTDARTVLIPWLLEAVDSDVDAQFVDTTIVALTRSSNVKLQRNVLLALCLLRHRSVAVRETLESCDVLQDVLRLATDDVTLPVQLIRLGLLCLDKRSALWLDTHSVLRERRRVVADNAGTRLVPLVTSDADSIPCIVVQCAANQTLRLDDKTIIQQVIARRPPLDSPPNSNEVMLKLSAFQRSTVETLVTLLSSDAMTDPPPSTLSRLPLGELEALLRLTKSLQCVSAWHKTTLAITSRLTTDSWPEILAVSERLGHPLLFQRALRVAVECASPSRHEELVHAAWLLWNRVLAPPSADPMTERCAQPSAG
ncbi:hypothetical protein PINS_up006106 [Pythium insidiosum]|nr:hypothetical protein PINS_up006106 [Pythium insidiosum]